MSVRVQSSTPAETTHWAYLSQVYESILQLVLCEVFTLPMIWPFGGHSISPGYVRSNGWPRRISG
jgi:hypothetical protein